MKIRCTVLLLLCPSMYAMEENVCYLVPHHSKIIADDSTIIHQPPAPIPAAEFFTKKSLPADVWRKILDYMPVYDWVTRYIARYVVISNEKAERIVEEIFAKAYIRSPENRNKFLQKIADLLKEGHALLPGYDPYNALRENQRIRMLLTQQNTVQPMPFLTALLRDEAFIIWPLMVGLMTGVRANRNVCIPYRKNSKNKGLSYEKIERLVQYKCDEVGGALSYIEKLVCSSRPSNRQEKVAGLIRGYQDFLKKCCVREAVSDHFAQFLMQKYQTFSRPLSQQMIQEIYQELSELSLENTAFVKKMAHCFIELYALLSYSKECLGRDYEHLVETQIFNITIKGFVPIGVLSLTIISCLYKITGSVSLYGLVTLLPVFVLGLTIYLMTVAKLILMSGSLGFLPYYQKRSALRDFQNTYVVEKLLFCKVFIALAYRAIQERESSRISAMLPRALNSQ